MGEGKIRGAEGRAMTARRKNRGSEEDGEGSRKEGKGDGVVERTPVLQKYSGKGGAHTHQKQSEIGGAQGHSWEMI